jgi:hypothetical protein
MNARWFLAALLVAPIALSACSKREFDPPDRPDAGNNATDMSTPPDLGVVGGNIGDDCSSDDDCSLGLICDEESSTCQPSGETAEGQPCFRTAECAEGLYCDAFATVCMPAGDGAAGDSCGQTGECQRGLVCVPSGFSGQCAEAGEADIGGECDGSLDCLPGLGCAPPLMDPEGTPVCQAGPAGLPRPYPGVECAENEMGNFRSYFEVPDGEVTEFYRLPYPNDIRIENGHPNLEGHPTPGDGVLGYDLVQRYIDTIEQTQDRFGLNSQVYMRFSEPPNFDSIESGGDNPSIYTTVLDPDHDRYGDTVSMRWTASTGRASYICQNRLAVRPGRRWGRPLDPNTTYAVILTTDIESDGGVPASQDDDFAAMLEDSRPSGALGDAWDAYQPLRDWIADQGIDGSTIANAAVFTTGDPKTEAAALAAPARAEVPTASELTLCDDGVTSPCDDGLDGDEHQRGCFGAGDGYSEIQGKISLPVFQNGTAPYLDEGGDVTPDVKRREDVCMAMTVPDATQPEDGWPVLIYAHGTGGSYRSHVNDGTLDVVNSIDVDGETVQFLTIGWDQVQHFTRRGDSEMHPNELVFNYGNPAAAKGNFLQAAADLHAVAAWAEQIDIPADQSPTGEAITVNPEQVYFMGHSQGGTSGPLALPYDSTIKGSVLSGAGAGLILALLGKTSPVNSPAAVQFVLMEEEEVGAGHPVLNLLQAYFDPVDPVNFGEFIGATVIEGETTPSHVFHTNGIDDTFTPPKGMDAMARALRATYILPFVEEIEDVPTADAPFGGNVTHDMTDYSVLGRQYAPDGYDGHFVIFRNPTAQSDLGEFLGTAVTTGVPEIR